MSNLFEDDVVAEVRRHRAELLEEYGGIEGYLKHLEEDWPRLERDGWKLANLAIHPPARHIPATA